MHIWAENSPADNHNNYMLGLINEPLVTVIADDQYPAKLLYMISIKLWKGDVVQMEDLITRLI